MLGELKATISSVTWVIRSPSAFTSSSKSCNFWLIMVPKMRLIWLSWNQNYTAQSTWKGRRSENEIAFKCIAKPYLPINVALRDGNGVNIRFSVLQVLLSFCVVGSYKAGAVCNCFSEQCQKTFVLYFTSKFYHSVNERTCANRQTSFLKSLLSKYKHVYYHCDCTNREACMLLTWGKVMLMRLNLLCSRLEITILPPPGGPMEASTCIPCWVKQQCIHKPNNTN